MMNREQISKIAAFSKIRSVISAIYLFGSHASGYDRAGSDIDLGVLFTRNVSGLERIAMETEISNLLKKEVDLVDMRKCGPFLLHQIHKCGKTVYHDGSDFAFRFRAGAIRDYLDTGHLRMVRRAALYGE
jgi:predicted nucleotidyltransferase